MFKFNIKVLYKADKINICTKEFFELAQLTRIYRTLIYCTFVNCDNVIILFIFDTMTRLSTKSKEVSTLILDSCSISMSADESFRARSCRNREHGFDERVYIHSRNVVAILFVQSTVNNTHT